MLYYFMSKLFAQPSKVPSSYLRMIRNEFREISPEYVESFLKKNNRLPTVQELQHAI